jgi:hypothetical protein
VNLGRAFDKSPVISSFCAKAIVVAPKRIVNIVNIVTELK